MGNSAPIFFVLAVVVVVVVVLVMRSSASAQAGKTPGSWLNGVAQTKTSAAASAAGGSPSSSTGPVAGGVLDIAEIYS